MPISLVESAFCTIDDVIAATDSRVSTTEYNDTFALFINLFSKGAEGPKFCNRTFQKQEYTEIFNGYSGLHNDLYRESYPVKAPPIEEGSLQVWDDTDRVFGSNKLLVENTDYWVDYEAGIIYPIYFFTKEFKNIKIKYNGGITSWDENTETLISPADLRTAAAIQCGHWWKQRQRPGVKEIVIPGGGSISVMEPTQILPFVHGILLNYKRFTY